MSHQDEITCHCSCVIHRDDPAPRPLTDEEMRRIAEVYVHQYGQWSIDEEELAATLVDVLQDDKYLACEFNHYVTPGSVTQEEVRRILRYVLNARIIIVPDTPETVAA